MSLAPTTTDAIGDLLMRLFWRKPAATLAERMRRRVCVHLGPVLFFLYILAYLDRANLSVARLGMELPPDQSGLGIGNEQVGWAFGMFFWSYWILEIPSTLSVVRWGARWVFCRILVLWGICATLTGFIGMDWMNQAFGFLPKLPTGWTGWPGIAATYFNSLPENPLHQLHVFRILLGFFEGGFFPSVIVYLTYWFKPQDRAKAIAAFMTAIPISSVLGLPVSGLLLGVKWLELAGWRWVFIVEGIIPILAGVAVLWFLPNRPKDAAWMPADERDYLQRELDEEHAMKQRQGHGAWKKNLGMVLLLTLVYFGLNVSSYGLITFMPKIIEKQLAGWGIKVETVPALELRADGSPIEGKDDEYDAIRKQNSTAKLIIAIVAALPYVMAFFGMWLNAWHSDRTHERIWHVAVPLAVCSLGLFMVAACDGMQGLPLFVTIFVVGSCVYAHLPAFWPIPSLFLGSAAAASAIGFINMIGNFGGSYGPIMMGKAAQGQESFGEALMWIAPWPLTAAAVILIVGFVRRRQADAERTLDGNEV